MTAKMTNSKFARKLLARENVMGQTATHADHHAPTTIKIMPEMRLLAPVLAASLLGLATAWSWSRNRPSSSPWSWSQDAPDPPAGYVAMPYPDRLRSLSHAIGGVLLQSGSIRSYHVYRRIQNGDNSHQPLVVAHIVLSDAVNGHESIVHGGILALLIDDVLGFGFAAARVEIAVTANLSIDYRAPVAACSRIRIACELVAQTPRKLSWKATVTDPEETIVYCEASSVYVIPKSVAKAT